MLDMIALICYSQDIMLDKSGHSIIHRTEIAFCLEVAESSISKLMHSFILLRMKVKIFQVHTVDLYVFGVYMYMTHASFTTYNHVTVIPFLNVSHYADGAEVVRTRKIKVSIM
jgi:hypothetical protein